MTENDLSYAIRGAAFKVHNELGPGLLEPSYEAALAHELNKQGFKVDKQLLTCLKLSGKKLGLLMNFNVASLKNGIVRIVYNL